MVVMARIDTHQLGEYIREQRLAAQVSMRQLAQSAGVSNPYLSQVERGLRRPSAEILNRIAMGLRISAETLYVRAGILAERAGNAETIAAIVSDDTITEPQRQVLLNIYETFQQRNQPPYATADQANQPKAAEGQTEPVGLQQQARQPEQAEVTDNERS